MRESPYFRALQSSLHGAGVPYGYSVTVWGTGAAIAGEHGVPTEAQIALFVVGATAGYGGLRLLTWETEREAGTPLPKSPNLLRAGIVHVAAIGVAIAAALLIAAIGATAAWSLAPFAATLLYLSVSSIEVAKVEEENGAGG